MPFDGTLYRGTTDDRPSRRRSRASYARRVARSATQLGFSAVLTGLVCFATEGIYPNRGVITLLTNGPGVLHQNIIAYDLMSRAQRLEFWIGGRGYAVLSPDHALTVTEQDAWLGFAKWKGLPVYTVDGELAVDP